MVPEFAPAPTDRDALRHELARHGVSLFERVPADRGPSPSVAELSELVVALAESEDARLEAAIPCLIAACAGDKAHAIVVAAARRRPSLGAHVGWLYRLARALIISRRPELERLFGVNPDPPPFELEPTELPDPSVLNGEATPWAASEGARDRGEPDDADSVVQMFDKWLRLRSDEVASARA